METYKISVTTLESFRRFMAGTSSWDTEQSVVDKLKGLFKGTDKTRIGGAFHKIIENKVEEPQQLEINGIQFSIDQVKPACEYVINHPQACYEVPTYKVYETRFFNLMVRGRVDNLEGIEIRDTKTKFNPPKFMEYYDSYQWRLYLDMLLLDVFWYDVFEFRGYKSNLDLTTTTIIPHEPYQCIRYSNLQQDCMDLINRFANWIYANNYQNLLKSI